jgi:hypothetical protein
MIFLIDRFILMKMWISNTGIELCMGTNPSYPRWYADEHKYFFQTIDIRWLSYVLSVCYRLLYLEGNEMHKT